MRPTPPAPTVLLPPPWASASGPYRLPQASAALSDRHVEIMRDDLSEIFYDAEPQRRRVRVRRSHHRHRRGRRCFVRARGAQKVRPHRRRRRVHSGVRSWSFGERGSPKLPRRLPLGGFGAEIACPRWRMDGYFEPDRLAMVYTADHLDDARAVFIFRPKRPVDYDHRDVPRQQDQLRAASAGSRAPRWTAGSHELEQHADVLLRRHHPAGADQLVARPGDPGRRRRLLPWPRGRRQHQPRGIWRLRAGRGNRHGGGRPRRGVRRLRAHDDAVCRRQPVPRSSQRANTIVPGSRWGVRALIGVARTVSVLPLGVTQTLARLNSKGVRLYDSMPLPDYPASTTLL